MFKRLNPKKFNKKFNNEGACLQFLFDLKWSKGFRCRRCGNQKKWSGRTAFHARCTSCNYDESATAYTIFHKVKIPMVKAFTITFYITVLKKGISSRNLSELVGVGLKSVWLFRRKLQETMGVMISEEFEDGTLAKHCDVDGIILSHGGKSKNGLQKVKLLLQKRFLGKRCKSMRCFPALTERSEIDQCSLEAGRYVKEGKDILIWNFKAWLTGTHHHCSAKYLKGYLDEYCFRFNFRRSGSGIWYALILAAFQAKQPISVCNEA